MHTTKTNDNERKRAHRHEDGVRDCRGGGLAIPFWGPMHDTPPTGPHNEDVQDLFFTAEVGWRSPLWDPCTAPHRPALHPNAQKSWKDPLKKKTTTNEQKRHTSGQKPVFDPNTATPVRRLRGKIGEAPTWQARAPRQAGISVRILLQVFPLGSWHAPG